MYIYIDISLSMTDVSIKQMISAAFSALICVK